MMDEQNPPEYFSPRLPDRKIKERTMAWSADQALAWIIKQAPLNLPNWTSDMGPEIEPAGIKLGKAIGADQVHAWGRTQLHDSRRQISGSDFRISGLTLMVGPNGEVTTSPRHKFWTYNGPHWHDIEFDADEIKRAFPKPPPISAKEWMLKEAEHHAEGSIAKRDDMVRRCMKETNCTKREAEAAHKSLPDGLKRKRGKPPKNFGVIIGR